ncbi:MAG: hypothetical protein A2Y09_08570 [Planctomycetes bacterium GWA2_39_15]|nr:MAG: hypothetical protein A2Y09_08570 [Planctomycetes bacterium GWA2_39_15]
MLKNYLNPSFHITSIKMILPTRHFVFLVIFLVFFSVIFIYFALLKSVARFLVVNDIIKNDAVVVLGVEFAIKQIIHAVSLYEKGIAPLIILTGYEITLEILIYVSRVSNLQNQNLPIC